MKRTILTLGLFSLCCLAVVASYSQAGFCCLFGHHNRCVTHITCRPYNAFTPICWGNLVCDGCCPNMGGCGGGCQMPSFGYGGCGIPYMGMACAPQYGYAGDMAPAPKQPAPNAAPFTPPMPMPSGPGTTMMVPPYGVSQASYYPFTPMAYPNYYYPGYYYPNYYQPPPMYWYGYGR
jgi:hypothetical protein